MVLDELEHLLALRGVQHQPAGHGYADQHERRDPVGAAGGVHRAGAGLSGGDNRRALAANRVEYRLEIVHLLLEGERAIDRVRQAGSAAIEPDETAEGGVAMKGARQPGVFPLQVEVRSRPADEQDVGWPRAHCLVGDPSVAAVRVPGGWHSDHRARF